MPNNEQINSQVSAEDINEWWPQDATDWSVLESSDTRPETTPDVSAEFSQEAFETAYNESKNNHDSNNPAEARRIADIFETVQRIVRQSEADGQGPTSYAQAFNLLHTDIKNAQALAEKRSDAGDPAEYHQKSQDINKALELYNQAYQSIMNAPANHSPQPEATTINETITKTQPAQETIVLPGDLIS